MATLGDLLAMQGGKRRGRKKTTKSSSKLTPKQRSALLYVLKPKRGRKKRGRGLVGGCEMGSGVDEYYLRKALMGSGNYANFPGCKEVRYRDGTPYCAVTDKDYTKVEATNRAFKSAVNALLNANKVDNKEQKKIEELRKLTQGLNLTIPAEGDYDDLLVKATTDYIKKNIGSERKGRTSSSSSESSASER